MQSITFTISEIDSVGQHLAAQITPGCRAYFYGAMGAGKTTLIKSLCAAMGIDDVVASPTFALVNEYRQLNGNPVFHFDFYRVNTPSEVYDLGYEEYFYNTPEAVCLAEWPEVVEQLLPTDNALRIELTANTDGSRTLKIAPF